VFMAATSAMSAELIACSSIITYDLIGVYVKPLTGAQVVTWSHCIIALLAVWMGVWSIICNYAGIDLGWLYYFQGTICSPAVVSIGLTVCWKRQSRVAALYGTLLGAVCGMVAWFVSCWKVYGTINIPNLSAQYSALASCLTGLVVSGVSVLVLTWLYPDPTDAWAATRAISGSDNVRTDHNLTHKDEEEIRRVFGRTYVDGVPDIGLGGADSSSGEDSEGPATPGGDSSATEGSASPAPEAGSSKAAAAAANTAAVKRKLEAVEPTAADLLSAAHRSIVSSSFGAKPAVAGASGAGTMGPPAKKKGKANAALAAKLGIKVKGK